MPLTCARGQVLSLWANEQRTAACVTGVPVMAPYDIYVFLDPGAGGAMAVEYRIDSPPGTHSIIGTENGDFISCSMGDPFLEGVSLAFSTCQIDPVCLQKLTVLPLSADVAYFNFAPHADTGLLAVATCESGYPKEAASALNQFVFNYCEHTPPYISAIEAYSPISIRVDFNPCVNTWASRSYYTHFTMYDVSSPADTARFIEAYQEVDTSGALYLVTEAPMVEGTTYRLEADDVCCDCNGCGDSWLEWTYGGGFSDLPDLDIITFRTPEVMPDSCASIPIEFLVVNNGSAAASEFDILIEYYDYPGIYLTLFHDTYFDLGPGSSVGGTIYIDSPDYLDKQFSFLIKTDTGGEVEEWIEFNNNYASANRSHNPSIISVEDCPGDYGGMVTLRFSSSFIDDIFSGPRVDYEIYRRDLLGAAWTCIDTLPGTDDPEYEVIVATEADSTQEDGVVWSAFMVNALVDYGAESYMSCPDSGYSVNDLGEVATALVSSSLSIEGDLIVLAWEVSSIDRPQGAAFRIERSEGQGPFEMIEDAVITAEGMNFRFNDRDVVPGKSYRYRVYSLDGSGERRLLFETQSASISAAPLVLTQNSPNPFNPSTEIRYCLSARSFVNLNIYDVSGRLVICLVSETVGSGWHTASWNGMDSAGGRAASGIYIYRIEAGKERVSKKMVLLR